MNRCNLIKILKGFRGTTYSVTPKFAGSNEIVGIKDAMVEAPEQLADYLIENKIFDNAELITQNNELKQENKNLLKTISKQEKELNLLKSNLWHIYSLLGVEAFGEDIYDVDCEELFNLQQENKELKNKDKHNEKNNFKKIKNIF